MSTHAFVFRGSILSFLMFVSFFGLTLTAVFTFSPHVPPKELIWRKPLVGSMFGAVCLFGILAVFFPNECSRVFGSDHKEKSWSRSYGFRRGALVSSSNSKALRGHHPDCGRFSSHVFRVGSMIFCCTCSGLLVGALVVLVGVTLYFFGNWQLGQSVFLSTWIGMLGVINGLLYPLFPIVERGVVRGLSSSFFAIGTFLILVGLDELARNALIDVFLVLLAILWLLTRISLSQWEHQKICSACSSVSCDLRRKIGA